MTQTSFVFIEQALLANRPTIYYTFYECTDGLDCKWYQLLIFMHTQ